MAGMEGLGLGYDEASLQFLAVQVDEKKESKGNSKILCSGGLEHNWMMTFHSVGKFIIPTDELIFFRG